MEAYKKELLEFCIQHQVLKFGDFKLKSGRQSPYFFNAGNFSTGQAFLKLAEAYSQAILKSFTPGDYDMLFGPAYKGISLATSASIGLAQRGRNVPVCFNRKEVKDHGEGGRLIGAPLKGKKALLVDDVITAGTTVREAVHIASQEGGRLSGIIIALDRQERGLTSQRSALQEVAEEFQLSIVSIVTLADILEHLETLPDLRAYMPKLKAYQAQWGSI